MAYTTIDDPSLYFQVQLYTGTGSSQAITLSGATDMALDILWLHNRDAAEGIDMYDRVRGVTSRMRTSTNSAQDDQSANSLSAFGSDGFTVLTNTAVNADGNKYVAYCWDESATSGVDIVAYDGTGSAHTEAHSLSAVPHVMIVKNREAVEGWAVYHHKNTAAPETDVLEMNATAATVDNDPRWNDTAPTSSVFTVGDHATTNQSDYAMIAYLFTEKQGFSKFGSYEGNGAADGTFVYTGFRPAFVMCKSIDSTSDWLIFDDQREGYNVDNDALKANSNIAETTTDMIDILSNGFKCRIATDPNVAETYVYMAFAKAPFVSSGGVPCNAR